MFRAVVTSDWHLMGLHRYFNNSMQLQMREIRKPFIYAVENGIDHVIVAGDLCHTPFMSDTALIEVLSLIYEFDEILNIYYIFGNHDYHDEHNTSMEILKFFEDKGFFKNLRVFLQPQQEEIDGETINFLPWPANASIPSKNPALNICHIEQYGAKGDNGYALKTKDKFEAGENDWTISGHIHKHQKVGRFIYCGAPYQMSFGENYDSCGFIDIKFSRGRLKFKHLKTKPEFRLTNIQVEKEEDFVDIKEEPNKLYKLFVKKDVVVPMSLTSENSSVFSVVGNKSIRGEVESVSEVPEISLDTGLSEFLVSKGLNKEEVKKAISEVKKAISIVNGIK